MTMRNPYQTLEICFEAIKQDSRPDTDSINSLVSAYRFAEKELADISETVGLNAYSDSYNHDVLEGKKRWAKERDGLKYILHKVDNYLKSNIDVLKLFYNELRVQSVKEYMKQKEEPAVMTPDQFNKWLINLQENL